MGYRNFRYARRVDADIIGVYHDDMTRMLTIDKATANTTKIIGQGVTGDDFLIKANSIDLVPYIQLKGNDDVIIDVPNNKALDIYEGGGAFVSIFESANGCHFHSKKNNVDLFLKTEGSGVVKFGAELTNPGVDRGKLIRMKTADGTELFIKTYNML